MLDLAGKLVVITGGSSGIGLAMAKAFAGRGSRVVTTGRSHDRLIRAAASHDEITPAVCDVTSDEDVFTLRETVEALGGADVLVNNAGVMHTFDVTTGNEPLDKQVQEIAIDVTGPVRMVHQFLPAMLERPSAIINVSSGLAYVPYAATPVYSGAKSFLHAYTVSLRQQLKGTSVRVVELLPPVIDTPLAEGIAPGFARMSPETLVQHLMSGFGKGRGEIAPGASWQLRLFGRFLPRLAFRLLNADARREQ
ncbi:MAG: SDR family NAD(P)-dependent oxidoreductase [Planctomycetota bacterium]